MTASSIEIATDTPVRVPGLPIPSGPMIDQAAGARRWWLAVAGLVLGALILRVWGLRWGLPFAYNLDERSHFVPRAVAFFDNGSIDPDYQLNPSGLIEWVAAALLITHFSPSAIVDAWREDPGQVWTIARPRRRCSRRSRSP